MFESLIEHGEKQVTHFRTMLGKAHERKSQHYIHFYETFLNQWTGYVRGVKDAQNAFTTERMKPCSFCLNASVEGELTDDDDLSYCGVGDEYDRNSQIHAYIRSGNGQPTALVVSQYLDKYKRNVDVIEYEMKYCPECGRPLIENGFNSEQNVKNEK